MCVCVRASPVPRHSLLGCAVWVCVLGLGFRLRPAIPSWGVGVCVCLCARSACTPPIAAGVCSVGVCGWARFSAAPRRSWLGCLGVCVFVYALLLYPANPGWGVRCGCVWLGSGFGCAPPFLAVVLGCVCVCVRTALVPHESWLGCAVRLCVLGLGFRLRPATPGWGVGVCVCLCARSSRTPPLLAGVCGVGVCPWARVSAAPCHSWLGCWGLCVFVCALLLYPANHGWFVRCGCVWCGSGFGRAPPFLLGVLGCVCVCVRTALVPHESWLGCAVRLCVLGIGFPLRPATPGWGVGVCVCLCACSSCTLPIAAGVCSAGVCATARLSAAPRHSWPGCWGLCVFVCALLVYPATPCWDVPCGCVWLGWGFGCAPPFLAGVLGCVRTPLVPHECWLGCAVWLCVLGLGSRLRPATPGWGVGVCVSLCARFSCTPPLLAGVCGVGVCAWARLLAAPRHSWLGCWGLFVFKCVLLLYPTNPDRGVRCRCVCLGSGLGCAPPLLAGVLGSVCVYVCAPPVGRQFWLGCAVWVHVLGLGVRLRPATHGSGVGVCVCLCARPSCTPPILAGVCGVGVCAWAQVSAAPRHCCGCFLGTLLYSCASCFSKIQNHKSTNLAGSLDGAPIHRHFTNSETKTLSRDQCILQHFIHTTGIRCFLSIHRLQCDCDCDLRARCAAAVRSHNTTPPLRPQRGLIRLGGRHMVASDEQA